MKPIVYDFDVCLDYIEKNNLATKDKDIYEFGLCTGNSTEAFFRDYEERNLPYNWYYGFDSMQGLPDEKEGIHCPPAWAKGQFAATMYQKVNTPIEACVKLSERFEDKRFTLIDGFYCDTLQDGIAVSMKPAVFISMDVDLYISCYQALDFMFRNNLIIKGTVIRYDDWDAAGDDAGENLAHRQICEKYNVEFERICQRTCVMVMK